MSIDMLAAAIAAEATIHAILDPAMHASDGVITLRGPIERGDLEVCREALDRFGAESVKAWLAHNYTDCTFIPLTRGPSMIEAFADAPCSFVVMPSGARIELDEPERSKILLADIAERMSTIAADASAGPWTGPGFYSLAQRAVLLAQGVAQHADAMGGLYALLALAPQALAGNGDVARAWFAPEHLPAVIHTAFDLDFPLPVHIADCIAVVSSRLRLAELRCLRRGMDHEIARREANGIAPLLGRIPTLPPEKACTRFIDTFKIFASMAGLPRTQAWERVQ